MPGYANYEHVIEQEPGVLILMLNGRLDTNSAPEADRQFGDSIDQGETRVLVDFAKTDCVPYSRRR
jgi:anti-anti-sigma regulatory factor